MGEDSLAARPGALLSKQPLLVLESYHGHLTDAVRAILSESRTDFAIIPGGMTSQLQPLSLNKLFKNGLRKYYAGWLTLQGHQLTPSGRIKCASLSQVASWIAAALDDILVELTVRAFCKCSISNALYGTENSALWEDESDDEASNADEDESDE